MFKKLGVPWYKRVVKSIKFGRNVTLNVEGLLMKVKEKSFESGLFITLQRGKLLTTLPFQRNTTTSRHL